MREVPEALERELETRRGGARGKAGASHAHETAANDPDALADVAYRLRSFLYERSGHEGAGDTLGVGAEDDLLDASRFLSERSEALRVNTVSRGSGKGNALGGGTPTPTMILATTTRPPARTIPTPTKASRPRHRGVVVWRNARMVAARAMRRMIGAMGLLVRRARAARELRGSAVAAPFEGRGAGDEAAGCEGDEEGMAKIRDRGAMRAAE